MSTVYGEFCLSLVGQLHASLGATTDCTLFFSSEYRRTEAGMSNQWESPNSVKVPHSSASAQSSP